MDHPYYPGIIHDGNSTVSWLIKACPPLRPDKVHPVSRVNQTSHGPGRVGRHEYGPLFTGDFNGYPRLITRRHNMACQHNLARKQRTKGVRAYEHFWAADAVWVYGLLRKFDNLQIRHGNLLVWLQVLAGYNHFFCLYVGG